MPSSASVLVFGARGQIGRALLPRLIDAGCEVHAAGREALVEARGYPAGMGDGSTGSPPTGVAGREAERAYPAAGLGGEREWPSGVGDGSTGSPRTGVAGREAERAYPSGIGDGSTGSPRTGVAGLEGEHEYPSDVGNGSTSSPRTGEAEWKEALAGGALHFHRLDLHCDGDPLPATDLVISAGPLDAFAAWFEQSARAPRRVIAFGSTSVHTKHASPDAGERDVAQRLRRAEETLLRECARRGAALTLLRPTLVYGAGLDRNLTRIAALARRFGFFVLPRGACGLRQPVHVDDLADAAWRVATSTVSLATAYDLPGGETLTYREMVARVLACLAPPPRLVELPSGPLRAAGWCAHRTGLMGDAGAGVWARLTTDLVFDAQPARRDFGYAPRGFSPRAAMFEAPRVLLQRTM